MTVVKCNYGDVDSLTGRYYPCRFHKDGICTKDEIEIEAKEGVYAGCNSRELAIQGGIDGSTLQPTSQE